MDRSLVEKKMPKEHGGQKNKGRPQNRYQMCWNLDKPLKQRLMVGKSTVWEPLPSEEIYGTNLKYSDENDPTYRGGGRRC